MAKIRIITDSASDIVVSENDNRLLTVIPLTVTIGEVEYKDGVTITREEFYEKLVESDDFPKTSQIPPFVFEEEFKKARENGEQVIAITLSGKLSGTYQSACIAAEDYEDMVRVVDSENVTVGEIALINLAFELINQGKNIDEVVDVLNVEKKKIHLVALLDTLEYLKKGGRISPAVAAIGSVLSIKPVIAIDKGEVAMLGKARGSKQGNNLLNEQIKKAGGVDFEKPIILGYTGLSDTLVQKYKNDSSDIWKGNTEDLPIVLVGATIGTHIGPGGIAVAFFAKEA